MLFLLSFKVIKLVGSCSTGVSHVHCLSQQLHVLFLFFPIINQLDAIISQIYIWNEILHFSDSSSIHHQELFTVPTAMVYVIELC